MAMVIMVLGLVCNLASFAATIMILIGAFKESVSQGFMCLCNPFYVLYFAFANY